MPSFSAKGSQTASMKHFSPLALLFLAGLAGVGACTATGTGIGTSTGMACAGVVMPAEARELVFWVAAPGVPVRDITSGRGDDGGDDMLQMSLRADVDGVESIRSRREPGTGMEKRGQRVK